MRCLTEIDRDAIGQLLARDEFFWLDLTASDEELERVRHELGLPPPLPQPDAGRRRLFDEEDGIAVLACRSIEMDADGRRHDFDVHVYISGGWVITWHEEPLETLEKLRGRLVQQSGQEEEWAVSRVLDAIYDPLVEVLDDIDDRIAGIEADVIEDPDPSQLQRISELQRDLLTVRRRVIPQRDALLRHIDDIIDLPGLDTGDRVDLQDVSDFLGRVADRIDTYSMLLTSALDMYLSTTANRLNEVMWRLTVVATVFLPLTFVTGFFGQNFQWLTDHVKGPISFAVLGLTMCLLSAGGTYAWVKWTERRELDRAAAASQAARRR